MQCPDCGAYASEEDLFCGECGRPLAQGTAAKEPLSPEEAKDLPTVGVDWPAPRPSQPTARKRSSLAPVLLFVAIGLLLLCLGVGGLFLWMGSREDATATPIAAPTEIGPAAGVLLYKDDFDSAEGWDVFEDEETVTGYFDGEYRLGVYRADYMTWSNPELDQEFTDIQVEVDARQVEGPLDNNFGLLVRYQPDSDDFYWFQISADGYYSVDLRQANEWITLVDWEESDAIQQGLEATNRLKVVCRGSRFSLYVNDVFLAEVLDGTLGSGNVGLAAGAFEEGGVVIHFDNLRVYALQE